LVRELDERLGLEKLIEEHLSDSRQGLNNQFTLADLLRQSVYSRLAGYEDLNDAEQLAVDPTFRLISSQRIWDRGAALTSTLHWVRDRAADHRRESDRADGVEPGTCWGRPSLWMAPTASCSMWIPARVRFMVSRKAAPITLRAVAKGKAPSKCTVREIMSTDIN